MTPRTVAYQAPLSMRFSQQEYWSRLPFPPPGDLPDPGIKLVIPALVGSFFTTEPPGKPPTQKVWLLDIITFIVLLLKEVDFRTVL